MSLEAGTYEIIRNRLQEQSKILSDRLAALNVGRKAIFNTEQFALIANQRITTEHNGVARGIIALGEHCIFAYNVHFGLREEISLDDVFSIYHFQDIQFEPTTLDLIADPQFEADFKNLYKYYREAFFSKFYKTENYLYMIFQSSKNVADRKAFKWYIDGNRLQYIDDRSIHEVRTAPQYSFDFKKTSLEDRRLGVHPHISILDKVFIEAINGDITFKIEDNTESGLGIYSEPVSNKDQQLDDANYFYADLGNLIAIKIQPYQEESRAYIYNIRTKEVHNIPSLLYSGVLLPDQQGIIFSNGYYLQNGEYKLFDNGIDELEYMRTMIAPNGEDYLYVYYQKTSNTYVLMSYNVIQQQVNTPIICNGFTIFQDGKLIYFKSEREAIRHHQVQIWQTPYTAILVENREMRNNVLYKIGNKDIVHAMSEGYEIVQLLRKEDSYEGLYEDIARLSRAMTDSYFWLADEETFNLAEPLKAISEIANTAIDEFAKVQAQRQYASAQEKLMQERIAQLSQTIRNARYTAVDELVRQLHTVRLAQGSIIELLQVRYIDEQAIQALSEQVKAFNEQLSQETINFLLQENALLPYEKNIEAQRQAIEAVSKVIDAQVIEKECLSIAGQLELLIDILNSLKIEDTTQTTKIIENISLLFSTLNEVRALLNRKISTLKSSEAVGEFHAQLTLLEQSIVNFLDLSDTVEKTDNYFTKISVHIEELESKFADFDEFIMKIADKRDEVVKAFNGKKEMLIAQINKRTGNLEQIGLRVLKSVETKARSFSSTEEIFSFFAGDLMIEKIRNLAQELQQLGDVGKAENLLNSLKLAQENAVRVLHDQAELFVDGQNIIALGTYKFAVNKQELSLTIVKHQDRLMYHLMGTNFYQPIDQKIFQQYISVWDQDYRSENPGVYRAEYLAYLTFIAYTKTDNGFSALTYIDNLIERDYAGGYVKGVHNTDALMIFEALLKMYEELGVLRFSVEIRVQAQLYWKQLEEATREKLSQWIQSAHKIHQLFQTPFEELKSFKALTQEIQKIHPELHQRTIHSIASYLIAEFEDTPVFTASIPAIHIKNDFIRHLNDLHQMERFEEDARNQQYSLYERYHTISDWIEAFVTTQKENSYNLKYIEEAACLLVFEFDAYREHIGTDAMTIHDLKGTHPVISDQGYHIQYHDFLNRLQHFDETTVPLYDSFRETKRGLIQKYEQRLKIQEMRPKVLSSFMRNKLINEVYFPMIGANLSKQLGTIGNDKRTARMGMLLLISPPGYGKTTLMEYLAATMGLHFVKINGPTIGHRITSIDPSEATNSGAKAELEKINLSFEMADNVMLYVDDIQHCSPEFLQQFISLADGQRKIDGIFESESKTYDLRGKRFCVVMAGNPYTESGNLFKIPDMLANRSDVYNLGDVAGESRQYFDLSLIENAISENRYLQAIAHKNINDLYKLIQYIERKEEYSPELEANHTAAEIEDSIAVLKNCLYIRNIILQVNELYIQSAGMKDTYRTEPAFKLQGSYRNMNKMVTKVVPLMNEQELIQLVIGSYEADAQTLTSDAEANLLKLKHLMHIATPEEQARYLHITETFRKNNQFSGIADDDKTAQVLMQFSGLNEHMQKLVKLLGKRGGDN